MPRIKRLVRNDSDAIFIVIETFGYSYEDTLQGFYDFYCHADQESSINSFSLDPVYLVAIISTLSFARVMPVSTFCIICSLVSTNFKSVSTISKLSPGDLFPRLDSSLSLSVVVCLRRKPAADPGEGETLGSGW